VLTILASYYRPLTKSQLIKQSIKSLADKRRRRFVTWKGFLATQPDFVIMDMVFLVFHANELVKKKARDILASPVSEVQTGYGRLSTQRVFRESLQCGTAPESVLLNIEYLNLLEDFIYEQEIESRNADYEYRKSQRGG